MILLVPVLWIYVNMVSEPPTSFTAATVWVSILETGAVARASKVVYDRAHSSIAEIEAGMINWEEVLKDASWFHWTGITPAISQGAADACLEAIQAANKLGCTCIVRPELPEKPVEIRQKASEIMPELVAGCDVILGNEEDAEKVFGIKPEGFDVAQTEGQVNAAEFESVCTQLMEKIPACKESNHHFAWFYQRQS